MFRSLIDSLLHPEKIRFAAVGAINTAVDFAILFTLVAAFGMPELAANVVSTSAALAVSYLLNKKAVFKDTDTHNPRQVLLFVTVTLFGLWVLQGGVIFAITSLVGTKGGWVLLAAKCVASFFSLVWNWFWYSRVVFKSK